MPSESMSNVPPTQYEASLKVSAHDRVSSFILSMLYLVGFVVFLLFLLWLTTRATTATVSYTHLTLPTKA